jgi:hypothetical protein
MVDEVAGVNIGQRFEREAPALFLLADPGRQGLFDDPFT